MLESLVNNSLFNFIKERPPHKCFPVNTAKFLSIDFLENNSDGCFCMSPSHFNQLFDQICKIWQVSTHLYVV